MESFSAVEDRARPQCDPPTAPCWKSHLSGSKRSQSLRYVSQIVSCFTQEPEADIFVSLCAWSCSAQSRSQTLPWAGITFLQHFLMAHYFHNLGKEVTQIMLMLRLKYWMGRNSGLIFCLCQETVYESQLNHLISAPPILRIWQFCIPWGCYEMQCVHMSHSQSATMVTVCMGRLRLCYLRGSSLLLKR